MRRQRSGFWLVSVVVSLTVAPRPARAQPPGPPSSVESIRTALQSPRSPTTLQTPAIGLDAPLPRHVGVLTIVPPDTTGQFVKVSLPVGDLTMRATRAVAAARYRRAERDAREEVRRVKASIVPDSDQCVRPYTR